MKTSTIGLALGIGGVGVILTPVALFLITGYGSPIQRFLDSELAPGLPNGIMLSIAGAAASAVGIILYIKGMRAVEAAPPLATINRTLRPATRRPNQSMDDLEIEIERLIKDEMEPRVEVRTPSPRPQPSKVEMQTTRPSPEKKSEKLQQSRKAGPAIEVVSRGVDMVCKSCGAVSPLGQTSCSECGGPLFEPNPNLPPCPVCGAPLEIDNRVGERVVCTVCFSELRLQKI